jgi:hypothetical protein
MGLVGKNLAVTWYSVNCNGIFAVAMPSLTRLRRVVSPVNLTMPIAVHGLTVAVRVAVWPVILGGLSIIVVAIGVVG